MDPVTKPTAAQDSLWLDRLHQLLGSPKKRQTKNSTPASASRGRVSRRAALAALVGGGAAAGALLAPGTAAAQQATQKVNDPAAFIQILNHENTHTQTLLSILGGNARPTPSFANMVMPNFEMFAFVSQILENVGSGAYFGAAPYISNASTLAMAGSIGFIEARQAGWLNNAMGDPITANVNDLLQDQPFEVPLTSSQVVGIQSYFITSLNGGPALGYSTTPSSQNDIAILNTALAQEELELTFYLINLPRFFGNGSVQGLQGQQGQGQGQGQGQTQGQGQGQGSSP